MEEFKVNIKVKVDCKISMIKVNGISQELKVTVCTSSKGELIY
jgi:hypothetical protein